MVRKDKGQQYLAIKSMFEGGNVKKMRDIEKLYPTMVAFDMRMNHGRYIAKLHKPEEFTIKQIIKLASLIQIDPSILTGIIFNEITQRLKKRNK